MTTFVLVHGAHHGGWCWYKVAALLEARGHKVCAPDLPGQGRNAAQTAALATYVDHLCAILDGAADPVVLVGHSMGGAAITGAGEARPEKIARIVYLSAYITEPGQSMAGKFAKQAGGDGIIPVTDSTSRLYHDCPPEDAMLARLCLTPQAVQPLLDPIQWTAERWGSIPRTFIGCLQDRVFSIEDQRRRAAIAPGTHWLELDCGHSPFFAMPHQLADLLESL